MGAEAPLQGQNEHLTNKTQGSSENLERLQLQDGPALPKADRWTTSGPSKLLQVHICKKLVPYNDGGLHSE